MSEHQLGQRIRAARRRRGIPQVDLASQAGVSVDVIRKLEQGQRHSARMDTLIRIAAVLDQDVSDLIGKPKGLVVGAEDGEIYRLRRAVLDVIPAETEPPVSEALRVELGEDWRLYWSGRYAPLARALPDGITSARAGVRAARSGADTVRAQEVLADFLHLAACLLAHLAHDDLAALAMHQALTAAQESDNPLVAAGLSASRVWLLSRQGLTVEAENLAMITARAVEPRMGTANVDQVAIWGENLRYGCVALSRGGRQAEARELLPQLAGAAARVEAERPSRQWRARVSDKEGTAPLAGLGFGTTLASMTAVTVAVADGRYREALRLETQVPAFDSISPAMRSRHLLTVAWAQMAEFHSAESVHTLLRAEKLAPEMLAHQTIARTIVTELLPRRSRQRLPGLVSLAARVGVPTS
ncbi:helix-turn-helix domain-containing protein [Catellatospora vulcania]|uniref:helix-turn-helix domain-containing protein n=1 Tax=Catellatospora vulcania TaxID=1460450 RepID=UPI0012D3ED29|nr:helix-turn-helix domain-containing protein [Catellatospora vulcania]